MVLFKKIFPPIFIPHLFLLIYKDKLNFKFLDKQCKRHVYYIFTRIFNQSEEKH